MIITLDEAIPYWEEAFSGLGDIRPLPGRNIKREALEGADALIVRTVTRVDASLLEGSPVRFVASTSAGTDHIDLQYLHSRGIGFGHAPGSNANSVSEYIATALCVLAHRRGWALKEKSIAVIGVGNVGSRVARKMRAFGMKVLLCDPPLAESTRDHQYRDFEDVLGADILTFHVPLIKEGPYRTFHRIGREILDRLSHGQILINSSRGSVFDNRALAAAVREGKIGGVILDVWEGEPQIDYSLLERVDIGTPHIAGSSLDGKIRATEMASAALHDFFRIPASWNGESLHSEPECIHPEEGQTGQDAVRSVLLKAYDILQDDGNLRELGSIASIPEANEGFDRLRSRYNYRPEFNHFTVVLNRQCIQLAGIFEALGFQIRQSPVP
jgi:erythronate-4-phosphate dehydrogenase